MLVRFFIFSLLLFSSSLSMACECLWQGSFVEAALKADLIVSGTVSQIKGNAIDLKLDRTLRGKEFRETIRIWADDGKQCRPKVETFSAHQHWLMALFKINEDVPGGFNPNTPNISYGRINDYYLSKCGAYWLSLHDGFVTGNLIKGHRWQWKNEKMTPVLLELVEAYLNHSLSEQALLEAAKPQAETKKLIEQTKVFLRSQ